MSFEGEPEAFGRETISGWASYPDRAGRSFQDVGSDFWRYLLRLRWCDLIQALINGGLYRASHWSQCDMENRLAVYQREGEDEIIEQFGASPAVAADLRGATFDPNASHTVVPDWMRAPIAV